MRIVELRQVSSSQLDSILEQERTFWLDELHWDYRPSTRLIRKFVDSHSLAGCAAFSGDRVCAYGFYVLEESKALIGGLFVLPECDQLALGRDLLRWLLAAIRDHHPVRRIETQLMSFTPDINSTLREIGFDTYDRLFMFLPLKNAQLSGAPLPPGMRLERWDDHFFEPTARLICRAYSGHVDAQINDQYGSEPGAIRFLKNIVILPGCGEFQPYASFVLRNEEAPADEAVAGVVLTSEVSAGVGHITQVCLLPEFRGKGLGLRLLAAAVQALKSRRYHGLSLTVTAQNANAVSLYERLGFLRLRSFVAAVWQAPPGRP